MHPVVGVSWHDAKAFCGWLTDREHGCGALPAGAQYRLPTDMEWSISVGLGSEPGKTPEGRDSKLKIYPWGKDWPPPCDAGNYYGEEIRQPGDSIVIKGFNDGYPRTSPVGSFVANKVGLFDMGGNVWQWCEDWYNSGKDDRVLRGASWDDNDEECLLASYRLGHTPTYRSDSVGFRCVVGQDAPD